MPFHTAHYDTFVILGDAKAPPLWHWKVWKTFLPSIDPLIDVARGKPSVRSNQYFSKQRGEVKFGRVGWNESDHQKWTHGSPANQKASKEWIFSGVEVWAPGWNICVRENLAPDVFLEISDESMGGGYRQKLLFNPVIIVAVVSSLAQRQPSEVRAIVSALRKLTVARFVGFKRRRWGKAWGRNGFTDSIQDLASSGLFKKPSSHHKGKFGPHLFTYKWKPVS